MILALIFLYIISAAIVVPVFIFETRFRPRQEPGPLWI